MGNTIEIRIRSVVWTATLAVVAIAATLIVAAAWSADAAPGDTDSTYVPTAGCRAFDYRPAPDQVGPRSTPLGAGEVAIQQITGDVGECVGALAIPADAVAVAMNVTAVAPTTQTNLRLFPADLTEVPLLSNLNVSADQAPFPNKVDVTLSPAGAIKIFNQNGSVSVLGDVVGYYTNSSLADLDARLTAVESLASSNSGLITTKADAASVYMRTEIDALLAGKLDADNVLWAIVNADGSLAMSNGAVSAQKVLGPNGAYEVLFDREILPTCAVIATPATTAGTSLPAATSVRLSARLGTASGVFVGATNVDGGLQSSAFTVIVICP